MFSKFMVLICFCWLFVFICDLGSARSSPRRSRDNKDFNQSVVQITTMLTIPYVMKKQAASDDAPPEYEGYLIDLLDKLSEEIGFKYNVSIVKDFRYGSKNADGEWNGMIGEVMSGEADIAVADLTITSARQKVVHFSFPYMTAGIGLLMKRPPYFLNVEALMKDEYIDTTVTNATPIVIYPVSSIEDLPKQSVVQFGAIYSGSTMAFFKESKDPLYREIAQRLTSVSTNDEGAQRVKDSNGRFIFFMEGPAIQYITGKDCSFVQLGKYLNQRSYGFAMRKNYKMKGVINTALISLQEQGFLSEIKDKWFPQPRECARQLEKSYARNALSLVLDGMK